MSCKCGFCGEEIKGEAGKFWSIEDNVFIDICLKCEEEVKAL